MQENLSLLVCFFYYSWFQICYWWNFFQGWTSYDTGKCHPMNRGILNCGSTESIASRTLTYNLKYLPQLLIFNLEYNYLIWCSAALRARMASGRSLCIRMHRKNIYRRSCRLLPSEMNQCIVEQESWSFFRKEIPQGKYRRCDSPRSSLTVTATTKSLNVCRFIRLVSHSTPRR